MLKWISSRLSSTEESSHPLGSDKAIAAYLADLPTVDPQRTLREINEWLEDPSRLIERMPLSRALRAVEALDEFAQDAVASCWDGFLAGTQTGQANLIGSALRAFLTGSYASNLRIFELLAADPTQNHDKRLLARFAVRAMHAWVELKKLGRMTYQAADPSWWASAHALLKQAREHGALHLILPAYSHHQLQSGIWKEYQIGLLFETAPLTNLTANEIEATNRLVRWIEPHCRFVDSRSTLTSFCILTAGENMPTRCREDIEYGPETRFFGVGQGQNQLIQLRANLSREGKLPEWLASTGCNREQMLQLLQLLIANWSSEPPSRQHPRLQAKGTIRVVNGLDMVRRMIAASEFAKSGRDLDYDSYLKEYRSRHRDHAVVADAAPPPPPPKTPMDVLCLLETAGDQLMMDMWEIIDMSRGGLGARFSVRRPWQRIGALMAYRQDDELDWHVAIVRRLGSSHGKPNAGLSVFPGTPLCSQIRLATSREPNAWHQQIKETSGLGWHNAILVSAETKMVLIPSGIFSVDRRVHLSVEGHWRPARLIKLHARGNDYDLAIYQEDETRPEPA
jgi:hypothetical protein